MIDSRLILLNPNDNILICARHLTTRTEVMIDGKLTILKRDIDIGHKIARNAVQLGEKIIKYGVPIGSASADIQAGDHVHTHNLVSDYIPAHDRRRPSKPALRVFPNDTD